MQKYREPKITLKNKMGNFANGRDVCSTQSNQRYQRHMKTLLELKQRTTGPDNKDIYRLVLHVKRESARGTLSRDNLSSGPHRSADVGDEGGNVLLVRVYILVTTLRSFECSPDVQQDCLRPMSFISRHVLNRDRGTMDQKTQADVVHNVRNWTQSNALFSTVDK